MPRDPFTGWELDPDPLDATPPEPERRESRRFGCSVALLTLILALSGVPGVVASVPTPSEAPENRMGEAAGLTLAGAGEPAQGLRGAPQNVVHDGSGDTHAGVSHTRHLRVGKAATSPATGSGAPPSSQVGTAIYTASATWCAPTPDKCTDWGGNARLAAVNSFRFGDQPYPVRVHRGEMYVDVTVVSHCGCFGKDGYIDLSPAAFELLAPLGIGRIDVEVEVLTDLRPHPDDDRMRVEDGGPPLPQTDVEP